MHQAARHPAGTVLRCPTCHRVQVCLGQEITVVCTANPRGVPHRAQHMRPVVDADSRDKQSI